MTEMRTREEIEERLRELHGTRLPKEMGGMMAYQEAESLLWALGHDDPNPRQGYPTPEVVDVSDYMDVEE